MGWWLAYIKGVIIYFVLIQLHMCELGKGLCYSYLRKDGFIETFVIFFFFFEFRNFCYWKIYLFKSNKMIHIQISTWNIFSILSVYGFIPSSKTDFRSSVDIQFKLLGVNMSKGSYHPRSPMFLHGSVMS